MTLIDAAGRGAPEPEAAREARAPPPRGAIGGVREDDAVFGVPDQRGFGHRGALASTTTNNTGAGRSEREDAQIK